MGKFVLYWMQQAQRAEYNPALSYAIEKANERAMPLLIAFVFSCSEPQNNVRHLSFMVQGLLETALNLRNKGLNLHFFAGNPPEVIARLAANACEVVTDVGYLKTQRNQRLKLQSILGDIGVDYTAVETESLVPVIQASGKEEYAAATLRKKITSKLSSLTFPLEPTYIVRTMPELTATGIDGYTINTDDYHALLHWVESRCPMDKSIVAASKYKGGRIAATALLASFLADKLPHYATKRNDPSLDIQSGLSPYLHYGQISAIEIVQQLMLQNSLNLGDIARLINSKPDTPSLLASIAGFAEELIIRRELSFNFCYYNLDYDNFSCLPAWAKQTLLSHASDTRQEQYSLDRLLQCATNDVYWNAAQKEMMETGKMHNYMRMYWGKRIISWVDSPEDAFQIMLYLNNRYELDGYDPNSYAGVAWCFGKHDRPWQERPVFGKVRYMNAAGLQRKFNMDAYLNLIGV
jgi:deoxyribodipyrimidine photo-lyase